MFDVKCKAEIRHLNVRRQAHGDDFVSADDIKLMLIGVPVDRINSACPEIDKRFYNADQVAVGEVNPLTVQHSLENLAVQIGDVKLKGVNIKKKAKIHLLPGKVANVQCSIQVTEISDAQFTALRHLYLAGEANVKINERQLKLMEMNQ
jgi:hypothetical protein